MACLSRGTQWLLALGRMAPERVAGAAFIGPLFPYTRSHYTLLYRDDRLARASQRVMPFRWWGHVNPLRWPERYPEFAEWFISRCFSEPHSTKGIEDGIGWALETDHETMAATVADRGIDRDAMRGLAEGLDCPVMVISGDRDKITPPRDARALARFSEAEFENVPGAGHFPHARKPVQVNLALAGLLRGRLRPRAHAARPHRVPARRPAACAVHLLADRPGPRAARRGDRARAAAAGHPTSRSTGSHRTR